MKVPFCNVAGTNARSRDELMRAIGEVVDSGCFVGGPAVEAFEADFAAFCGTRQAVGVSNGTTALWLAMKAMGIGEGDEVVTMPSTYVATVEAIVMTGARPVLADIDEQSFSLDPAAFEAAITTKTRAVIPVHLFGRIAGMEEICEIARRNGIRVIEDAAQAHGAVHGGRRAGAIGDVGCFSFYPSKNLGALGDAGAVVTDDDALAERVRMLCSHGQSSRNHHLVPGWNARLDAIQAAVLSVKLKGLDSDNRKRCELAALYDRALANVPGMKLPERASKGAHIYHVYAVRVANRDGFIGAMAERGIECGIHYPLPIHLQPAYRDLVYRYGDFPVAERCSEEFVSLPMSPEMTGEQIQYVADASMEVSALEACA